MQNTFEQILELIRCAPRIIIHRHKNPDGDALGSQLGLRHILKDSFPDKEILAVGDMSDRYAFMVDEPMDAVPDEFYREALAIVLDTSAKALICDDRYTTAPHTARMDHHIFCENICEVEVTDTSFESCCGLVTAFAKECGLTVSPVAAKLLYTGMITDSGRFRYDSTNAQTHRRAAFLMERGFDTADIFRNLYSDDLAFIQLRAKFVLKIQTTSQRVAYIYTDRAEAESYGVSDFTLSRGMVTDSGRFRYDGTTSRTFRLASLLMEHPIDTNELFRDLYADDFQSKRLKATFILKIQFTENRVAYIYTTAEEFAQLNTDTFTVSRGMVNTMADIKGTDIWVNVTETDKGVLCELRSSKYNINPLAVKYGGGGHAKASGATVADRETAMAMLRDLDALIGENQ